MKYKTSYRSTTHVLIVSQIIVKYGKFLIKPIFHGPNYWHGMLRLERMWSQLKPQLECSRVEWASRGSNVVDTQSTAKLQTPLKHTSTSSR